MIVDEHLQIKLSRLNVRYSQEDGTVYWLRNFIIDVSECLRVMVEKCGGADHEIERIKQTAMQSVERLQTEKSEYDEEVRIRAGELIGMSNKMRHMRQNLGSYKNDNSELKKKASSITTEFRAKSIVNQKLEEALVSSQLNCDKLRTQLQKNKSLETAKQQQQLLPTPPPAPKAPPPPAPPMRKPEPESVEEIVSCKDCIEHSSIKTASENKITELKQTILHRDKTLSEHKRLLLSLQQELTDIRSKFGLVDAIVEKYKKTFPRKLIPETFHRGIGPDSFRWIFGTRTVLLHPAGQDVVAAVGGGYTPLKDFITRFGESESLKESRQRVRGGGMGMRRMSSPL